MSSTRCGGKNKAGKSCGNRTRADHLCWIHSQTKEGVRVKDSGISGAGKGLFAMEWKAPASKVIFKKNEKITDYKGETLTGRELRTRYPGSIDAKYVLRLAHNRFVDARNPTSCFGRFVNSNRHTGKRANCRLTKGNGTTKGSVKANRRIKQDEELLTSYGSGRRGLGYSTQSDTE